MTSKATGGSIVRFVITAIFLVGLLVGGAYLAWRYSQNTPRISSPVAPEQGTGDSQKPAENEVSTPPPATPPESPPSTNPSGQVPESTRLPQSGASDVLIITLATGLMVGATVSYIQSRRRLAPL